MSIVSVLVTVQKQITILIIYANLVITLIIKNLAKYRYTITKPLLPLNTKIFVYCIVKVVYYEHIYPAYCTNCWILFKNTSTISMNLSGRFFSKFCLSINSIRGSTNSISNSWVNSLFDLESRLFYIHNGKFHQKLNLESSSAIILLYWPYS